MNLQRFIAFLHKYLSLIIGVQILFWVISGLFFTIFPIEQVRSEHRMKEIGPVAFGAGDFAGLPKVLAGNANIAKLKMEKWPEGPRIIVETANRRTGRPRKRFSTAQLARNYRQFQRKPHRILCWRGSRKTLRLAGLGQL